MAVKKYLLVICIDNLFSPTLKKKKIKWWENNSCYWDSQGTLKKIQLALKVTNTNFQSMVKLF